MEKKEINCYLCNSSAFEWDAPDTSRNLLVECQTCKSYLLTTMTRLFFTHRKNGEDKLGSLAKEKLSKFVQKEYENTNKPVLITLDIIEAVTGKRSVNERFY